MQRSKYRGAGSDVSHALAKVNGLIRTLSQAVRRCKNEGRSELAELTRALKRAKDLKSMLQDPPRQPTDWNGVCKAIAAVAEMVKRFCSLLFYCFVAPRPVLCILEKPYDAFEKPRE